LNCAGQPWLLLASPGGQELPYSPCKRQALNSWQIRRLRSPL
jgi:hypothetical protein